MAVRQTRQALRVALAAVLLASASSAGPFAYYESFDGRTNDQTIATLNTYSAFSGRFVVDGSAVVANNQLRVINGPSNSDQLFLRPGVSGPTTVSAQVGALLNGPIPGYGGYNVGLRIGQNQVVFHPGYSGAALRVTGPGGFGNQNVGFTPSAAVLHPLEVASDGAGVFTVTLTDGANPANTWTRSFTNAGSVGGSVGLIRSGQPRGVGLYDDLTVGGATESFDTNTNAGTSAVYQAVTRGGTVEVDSGQLILSTGGASIEQLFLRSGLKRDHTIVATVGASASNGSYGVGLKIGQNNIHFHPGYGGAALRVEGPGGFGNTNVGFTPANNVLHELRVKSDGLGNFDVTLTDGANPGNTWTGSWTNPGSIGGAFGPRREGPTTGTGFYGSIAVEVAKPGDMVRMAELFDRNSDTDLTYPAFTENLGGGRAFVADSRLVLAPRTSGDNMFFTLPGPSGAGTVSTLVTSDQCNGSFNVGLNIGQNYVVFHPGYGGGALRVEGPGGFGNTNVGFTPANGVLHKLEVTSDDTGLFNITFTDGSNPANVWTGSFTNPGSLGGYVGPLRRGPTMGLGIYDDFTVNGSVQSFATDTDARAHYPQWTATLNSGSASVEGGVLILAPRRNLDNAQTFLTEGSTRPFELTALVGADNSAGGGYNVGLTIGQNDIVFHPGYTAIPGAFRVGGPGGFGNTDMGFVPATNVLHLVKVMADGYGQFDITVMDGADPNNVFTASFYNPGSVGGLMGFRRSGQGVGVGLFDNFIVTEPIPEPATLALLALGCAPLLRRRRRRTGV